MRARTFLTSWLLGRAGLCDSIGPPVGGRAPSWDADSQLLDMGKVRFPHRKRASAAPVNVVYENTASSLYLNDQLAATSCPVTSFAASSSSP
jgi:hypothetical protein